MNTKLIRKVIEAAIYTLVRLCFIRSWSPITIPIIPNNNVRGKDRTVPTMNVMKREATKKTIELFRSFFTEYKINGIDKNKLETTPNIGI
jgi:hypothetical protein